MKTARTRTPARSARPPAADVRRHRNGLVAVRQGTYYGHRVTYNPDWDAFCLHGRVDPDVVLYIARTKPEAVNAARWLENPR